MEIDAVDTEAIVSETDDETDDGPRPVAAKTFERRYHSTWTIKNGRSPLALLGEWMCRNPGQIALAPLDLLAAAAADVAGRLPVVAAREPTHRHRRHFAWLLGWHQRITNALEQGTS